MTEQTAVNEVQNQRINTVNNLYKDAYELMKRYATAADRLELWILGLSVLTSGAFWALASDAAPKTLGWAGALISTVVTFLTIYTYSSGIQKKRKAAVYLHEQVGKFLGETRARPDFSDEEFWTKYKVYETMVRTLPFDKQE